MTELSETIAVCPTACDPDCDAVCHEDHVAGHKKKHWPYDCPAADRYGWGGSDFIAAAVKRLKVERDGARTELAQVKESLELSEAQLVEVTLERAEWRKQAQQQEAVAKILRSDLVAAGERAEHDLVEQRARIVLALQRTSNLHDQDAERYADERSPLLQAQAEALWDAARMICNGEEGEA